MKNLCSSILSIAPHIKEALLSNKAVVALQSTIISHGMPYPLNLQCAKKIQQKVIQNGCIPATVGIIDGKIKIGLNQKQIQRLAYQGDKVKKVSRRDLPQILMTKALGATTVSATMIAAQMAGIQVFVTGGIGGVHRGCQQTMDVSADLRELGRTPVTVVSAGVKSILDIPKTLQYLETEGVPVITYKSQYFPAFFSSSSGIKSPSTFNTTLQIAQLLYTKQRLNLKNGVLVAVPNNNPAQGQMIQKAIQQALRQAQQQKIIGALITPFLLKRVNQLSSGKSLQSNISLVLNNAQIGSRIANDLSMLHQQSRRILPRLYFNSNSKKYQAFEQSQPKQSHQFIVHPKDNQKSTTQIKGKIIVVGASAIDSQYRPLAGEKFQLYKSCRGFSNKFMGGIGRNIAEVSARLGTPTTLVTPLGHDAYANTIRNFCKNVKLNLCQITSPKHHTAEYLTILDDQSDQMIGISQMQINSQLNFQNIYNTFFKQQMKGPKFNPSNDIVIVDANANDYQNDTKDLQKFLIFLQEQGYFVIYQCKGKKTEKIANPQLLKYVSLLRMNQNQYDELFKVLKKRGHHISPNDQDGFLSSTIGSFKKGNSKINELVDIKSIVTNKSKQIKLILNNGQIQMLTVPACGKIIKTTGAGDTLTGTLASMLCRGKSIRISLKYGIAASELSIQTSNSQSVISNQISYQALENLVAQK